MVRTMISFSVPIKPRPTPRPRGKAGQKAYYPKDYQSYKDELEWLIKQAWMEAKKTETVKPYAVHITVYKDRFDVSIRNSWRERDGVRGDLDNIQKGVVDALQAVGVIEDDRFVHEMTIRFG